MSRCDVCKGEGWVCENHPDRVWGDTIEEDGCGCGGAGEPCKKCNPNAIFKVNMSKKPVEVMSDKEE